MADHFKFKVGDILKHKSNDREYMLKVFKHQVPTNGSPSFIYRTKRMNAPQGALEMRDEREYIEEFWEFHGNARSIRKVKKALGI